MAKQALARSDTGTPEREEAGDGPLMDNMNQAVKNLITKGKERGYLTYDDVNSALPEGQNSSEQIEDVLSSLNEMGVNVVDSEESEEPAPERKEDQETTRAGNVAEDDVGRTDDPVRMYLREMGNVELLSREGEIAIAKRIEAGRELMIGGVFESPLAIKALMSWNEGLKNGEFPLRDIIDLDATYKVMYGVPQPPAASGMGPGGVPLEQTRTDGNSADGSQDGNDDDAEDTNISVGAMEERVLPEMLRKFDQIAGIYTRLDRLQEPRLERKRRGDSLAPQTERRCAEAAQRAGTGDGRRAAEQRPYRGAGRGALRAEPHSRRHRHGPDEEGRGLRHLQAGLQARVCRPRARGPVAGADERGLEPGLEAACGGVRRGIRGGA